MPRRLITSEICRNEKFGSLTDAGRVFFIGCFANADDDGRLKASPKYLKALIFPYDNDKNPDDVKEYRDKCNELGLIYVYNQNGSEYLYCIGWDEHQVIRKDRYRPSCLPAPNLLLPTIPQPSDNHKSTISQPFDNPNPIQSNIIQSNIIDDGKKLKKFPAHFIELRKQVFQGLTDRRKYKSRKPSAEALAISQMLEEGFNPSQILNAYDIIKKQPFWLDKHLTMMSVRNNIHEVLKDGTHKRNNKLAETREYKEPTDDEIAELERIKRGG